MTERSEAILSFWFGELKDDYDLGPKVATWWKKDPSFDVAVKEAFGADLDRAIAGELDPWMAAPRSSLALVIVLDQFSRNVFRDSPRAWAQDAKALQVTLDALDRGHPAALRVVERQFLYMPLLHAEDAEHTARCCALMRDALASVPEPRREAFDGWASSAERHHEIVTRFGRYPHRNAVLARTSTPEEVAFLKEPNSSF